MTMDQAEQTRLAELEIKLGLAEDHLEVLNRSIFRQQQQIDLLQGQMRELHRQMHSAAPGEGNEPGNPRDEIPPHY